ncbi:MAG: hypothetical protein PVTTEEND_000662 [Candidatus Fervidibacter sp.]
MAEGAGGGGAASGDLGEFPVAPREAKALQPLATKTARRDSDRKGAGGIPCAAEGVRASECEAVGSADQVGEAEGRDGAGVDATTGHWGEGPCRLKPFPVAFGNKSSPAQRGVASIAFSLRNTPTLRCTANTSSPKAKVG